MLQQNDHFTINNRIKKKLLNIKVIKNEVTLKIL